MAPPDDHAETVTDASATTWRIRWAFAIAFTVVALAATALGPGPAPGREERGSSS